MACSRLPAIRVHDNFKSVQWPITETIISMALQTPYLQKYFVRGRTYGHRQGHKKKQEWVQGHVVLAFFHAWQALGKAAQARRRDNSSNHNNNKTVH